MCVCGTASQHKQGHSKENRDIPCAVLRSFPRLKGRQIFIGKRKRKKNKNPNYYGFLREHYFLVLITKKGKRKTKKKDTSKHYINIDRLQKAAAQTQIRKKLSLERRTKTTTKLRNQTQRQ